jgi:hypothetical protein
LYTVLDVCSNERNVGLLRVFWTIYKVPERTPISSIQALREDKDDKFTERFLDTQEI